MECMVTGQEVQKAEEKKNKSVDVVLGVQLSKKDAWDLCLTGM